MPPSPSLQKELSLFQDWVYALTCWLGGRRGLIILGIVVPGAGLWLNWGWLVSLGIAPLILSVLPCAAMCALGLCMHGKGRPNSEE